MPSSGEGVDPLILRAAQALADGNGRTLVIAGPPESGKSTILASLLELLGQKGVTIRRLRGTYRDRNTAYAAVAPLVRESGTPEPSPEPEEEETITSPEVASFGYVPPEVVPTRRARGERQKGRVLGVSYAVRTRGIERLDAAEYWERFLSESGSGTSPGLALAVDDGTFVDPESRDVLLSLTERARLAPFLLAIVLNTADPSFSAWEEPLLRRDDVDWVRTRSTRIDPREASRLKHLYEEMPLGAQRILVTIALLGGSVPEAQLARVARLTFSELAEAILPLTEAHMLRVDPGRVLIPHEPWVAFLPELLAPGQLSLLHRQIAEALEAMSPEPTLARRREIAMHYFQWEAGPSALRYLLETAAETDRLHAYDDTDDLLSRALQCIAGLPPADRAGAEAELRLHRARALLFSGRVPEAERQLREGIGAAVVDPALRERLVEWIEPLVPALLAVGPRPSLLTELLELVERLSEVGEHETEGLLELALTELEADRDRPSKSRQEAHRIGHRARQFATPLLQALALTAVGYTRLDGSPSERLRADRFLQSAALMFNEVHRLSVEQVAIMYRARLLHREGRDPAATKLHKRAIQSAVQLGLASVELDHQLGLAAILLDRGADSKSDQALKRAEELADQLHLNLPSTGLLRLFVLQGRHLASGEEVEAARDRLRAAATSAGVPLLAATKAEARLRLAALELFHGDRDVAQRWYGAEGVAGLFPEPVPSFEEWAGRLLSLKGRARSGALPLARLVNPQPNEGKADGQSA